MLYVAAALACAQGRLESTPVLLLWVAKMQPDEEARRLVSLFAGNGPALIGFLSSQLAVLKNQAQMLMGLSAIAITVTGFSGHNMVRGGALSASAMICGISAILVGIVMTLRTLGKLRWVSQDLADDLTVTALAVISRRNDEQRALGVAGAFVAVGLGGYLLAVVLAAIAVGSRMGPPV